ncbi:MULTISPECIES: TnsD family Tn7-like transposition protein [Bacillus cereus group]|uniref:TnsD family Tn7-like transposition protein n=1 Tax=Bacillus cereus group TaxID=86661 RepID=UPI001BA91FF2|nr:TnsD family Tn7-like transposition protein [Bacillus cereus]MBR9658027.1 transposase [Bacillus cereus]
MIAYFLKLYPNELLYSWFARYHDHSGNQSPKHTMKDLFGTTNMVAVLDLPSNLVKVHEEIGHFNPPSFNTLIENHTLYKYYTFFQPDSFEKKAMEYIQSGGKPGAIHMFLGIVASTVKGWRYIRFCPKCFEEDQIKYGEPYWHTFHQLPKVHYCYIHHEPLLDSNIESRNPQKHQFISAGNLVSNKPQVRATYFTKAEEHLINLSKETIKLMKLNFVMDTNDLQQVYKYLLQIKGYANHRGRINQQYLCEQFKVHYGEQFLSLVDCNFDNNADTSWIRSMTRKHRKAFHPVQHLVMLNFLGVSIEQLPKLVGKQYYPFGESPYYCLNPAANHFKERVVTDLKITNCTDTRKPVGTFSCKCGFIYSRKGPDKNEVDQFKIGRIKQFGHVWERRLKELYIEGKSLYRIAKELQCDSSTVKKYVQVELLAVTKSASSSKNLVELKEIEWLTLLKNNPNRTVTELRKLTPALYAWHYRNNKEWLKDHSPKGIKKELLNQRVDWGKRDLEILVRVKEVARKLYAIEKPVFVNKSRVGKEIGQLSLLEKLLDKMPKTKGFLEAHLETREEYQIRRIKWACKVIYKSNDEQVIEWKVRRLAGLRSNAGNKVEVALKHEMMQYQQGGGFFEVKTMDIRK